MKRLINKLDARPKLKQYLWFIALWLAGFITLYIVAFFIRLMLGL